MPNLSTLDMLWAEASDLDSRLYDAESEGMATLKQIDAIAKARKAAWNRYWDAQDRAE